MSFTVFEKTHKNTFDGVTFSKGTIYFYKDFAAKHIKPGLDGVELHRDAARRLVGFRFTLNKGDAYKLHYRAAKTAYVMCKPFTDLMKSYGYSEKQVLKPKFQGGLWVLEK